MTVSRITGCARAWRRSLLLLLAGSTVDGTPAPAEIVTVGHLLFEVDEVDDEITAIELGDRFLVRFTLDNSATDTQPSTFTGIFPGLVTSFEMSAEPDNVGIWTPSGTFDLVGETTCSTSNPRDSFTFDISGTGFPDGGDKLRFVTLDLNWTWPFGTEDSGLGQTFAEQVPFQFGIPPAVFLGNGIEFEYEVDPGLRYEATFVDLTLFLDSFESGLTCQWSTAAGGDCD